MHAAQLMRYIVSTTGGYMVRTDDHVGEERFCLDATPDGWELRVEPRVGIRAFLPAGGRRWAAVAAGALLWLFAVAVEILVWTNTGGLSLYSVPFALFAVILWWWLLIPPPIFGAWRDANRPVRIVARNGFFELDGSVFDLSVLNRVRVVESEMPGRMQLVVDGRAVRNVPLLGPYGVTPQTADSVRAALLEPLGG